MTFTGKNRIGHGRVGGGGVPLDPNDLPWCNMPPLAGCDSYQPEVMQLMHTSENTYFQIYLGGVEFVNAEYGGFTFYAGHRYNATAYSDGTGGNSMFFGVPGGDEAGDLLGDSHGWHVDFHNHQMGFMVHRICWTPTVDTPGSLVAVRHQRFGTGSSSFGTTDEVTIPWGRIRVWYVGVEDPTLLPEGGGAIPVGAPTLTIPDCAHSHLHNDLLARDLPGAHTAYAVATADGATVQQKLDALDTHAHEGTEILYGGTLLDSWINQGSLTTSEGRPVTNSTRSPTGGPAGTDAYIQANGPWLAFTGLVPGATVRVALDGNRQRTGGGTQVTIVVQSGTTVLDIQSQAGWYPWSAEVVIGANGLLNLGVNWNPDVANLIVSYVGAAELSANNLEEAVDELAVMVGGAKSFVSLAKWGTD